MRRGTRAIGLLLLAGVAAACEPAVRPPDLERHRSAEPIVWPRPPERPRIRFVGSASGPEDLGIRPGFWKRLKRSLSGSERERFFRPSGVVSQGERLWVADPGSRSLWLLDTEAGRFARIREAGSERLASPVAVAPGPDGGVFLADSYLAKVFRFGADGRLIGTITAEGLVRPAGLAYDPAGDRLYVADSAAHRVWVFSTAGGRLGVIGTRGNGDGEFNFPTHLAVDRAGSLFVTDAMGFRIQSFDRQGRFLGSFGVHGDGSGEMAAPKGVAVDGEGHVYVVDALFDTVQVFDGNGRFLLGFGERGAGPGQFWLPGGLFIDRENRIYVADSYNQRIQVFEYLAGAGDG